MIGTKYKIVEINRTILVIFANIEQSTLGMVNQHYERITRTVKNVE